tara:strand:- start:1033 stop:1260 length:228 start_codon:yes stop_codon:yes gene_type:complete
MKNVLGEFIMIKGLARKRSFVVGLIFIFFGFYFLLVSHEGANHLNNKLLGLNEMTWMWLVMGISHFFLKTCDCKK